MGIALERRKEELTGLLNGKTGIKYVFTLSLTLTRTHKLYNHMRYRFLGTVAIHKVGQFVRTIIA